MNSDKSFNLPSFSDLPDPMNAARKAPKSKETPVLNDTFAQAIETKNGLPNSPIPPKLTGLSGVTGVMMKNQEFLAALFDQYEAQLGGSVPNVVSKAIVDNKGWGGSRWNKTSDLSNADLNWYLTLAAYTPKTRSKQKKDCTHVCGLMLDDIGTKALPLDRLDALPPTFVIETSSSNYQVGYMFDDPVTDFARCEAVNKAMIEAGLCDPGATGPTSRWGRLPDASNTKYDPVFKCRLVSIDPARRYSLDQIIEGLELVPPEDKSKPAKVTKAQLIDSRAEDVFVPRASENAVVSALKARGLYKRPVGGGKHEITCPWVTEHTGQIDHGTAYFEPDDLYPAGGFHCRHGHGSEKRLGALLEFLCVSFKEAKHMATIRLCAGEAHRSADAIEKELADTGRYFQTGGLVTSIVTDPASSATTIKPLKPNALLRAMGKHAAWERYDERKSGFVVTDPTPKISGMLFDAERYDHLPALIGLTRQPFLRPDASIVNNAGFDALTGFYGVFDARDFQIPSHPTLAQAEAALAEIRALLSEFRFSTAHDESAALAAILTAAARAGLELSPMFHVKAPLPGTGKSFLCSVIAAFVAPGHVGSNTLPDKSEELSKLLMSELMASPPAIIFDNLTSDLLPYPKLCSALTEPFVTDRILGFSKVATVSTRVLFLSSGNNCGPVRDMPRRCVTINLDPRVENPVSIEYARNPLTEIRQNRSRYVSLALTIIRAWHVNGKPYTQCNAFATYGQWCDWVRQPLQWLGMPDPVHRVFESLSQDPDRETLGRMLAAWRASFGRTPTLVREAIAQALTTQELREVCLEVAEQRGEINSKRLGNWISRHAYRIVDGMRFEKGPVDHSQKWTVKVIAQTPVTPVTTVSFGRVDVFGSAENEEIEVQL